MKCNYKELIQEITVNVNDGILSMEDEIQVLRSEKPLYQNYCAIIEWYYDSFTMEEELETPLEEMYLEEEFSKEEWKSMKEERAIYKEQYEKDREHLVTMKVKDVLTEMKQIQKLF